jgi:hypothetical protein
MQSFYHHNYYFYFQAMSNKEVKSFLMGLKGCKDKWLSMHARHM